MNTHLQHSTNYHCTDWHASPT